MSERGVLLSFALLATGLILVGALYLRGRTIVLPSASVLWRPFRRRPVVVVEAPPERPDGPGPPSRRGPPDRSRSARRPPPSDRRTAPAASAAPPVPEPAVHRLVIDGPSGGREREPQLPARVVAGSGWHGSFFHGWCGTTSGVRPAVRLNVRGATLRGASHADLNTEGQDAIGAAWDHRRAALYLAVADGLGSLPRSGPVALEAVGAALHLCTTRPDDIAFAENGQRLFEAIAAGLTRSLGDEDNELSGACTLIVAEVQPRFDGALVTVHGVGDSEAWALYGGAWTSLHHERGPDNSTRELPTHVRPNTREFDLPPGSVLALGSDGFAGALDSTVSPLAHGLARLWRRPPGWLEFLNQVSFVDDYWSDDRSAVAVWIGEGPADG
jgi:hypothetical protein